MILRRRIARWIGAALVAGLAGGLAGPAQAAVACRLGVIADLPITMEGLRATVPVSINGRETRLWLDSGAWFSIMSKARAIDLGLHTNPLPAWFTINGIGGSASAELATVKQFGIVGQTLRNVDFIVGGSDAGNGLLGRNLLAMADTEFDLANGSIKLIEPHDCDKAALAYWAPGKPYFMVPLEGANEPHNHHLDLPVTVNGARITATIDSGAPMSLLSRRAAQRGGIDLTGPGVVPVSNISGFGRHAMPGWIVSVGDLGVGDEHVLKARITVIDGPIVESSQAPDMLVGADFLMAHHVYVARGQRRIFFTYNGGQPFATGRSLRAEALPRAPTPAARSSSLRTISNCCASVR